MKVRILRQESPQVEPYWETFDYDGPADATVVEVLDYLNFHDDVVNDAGHRSSRIGWECSCLQGACGACAMVVNGVPALACETFLRDLKGDVLELRPLRKFPTVHDLVVDRSAIQDVLRETSVFIGEYQPGADKDFDHQFVTAKCLKCGLCLEVCPSYANGESFFGAVFANDCFHVAARNSEKVGEMRDVYREHFGKVCSKSLSCMTVCPANIPVIASIAKMNRAKAKSKTL